MWLLKLDVLEPGDVILEPGIEAVAKATDGIYGHASVALGKLVRIEAGKDNGVVISPFELAAYHRDGERLVGMPLGSGDTLVLRRRNRLDIGMLDGTALWEAGRTYDLHRALDLPDLAPQARDRLRKLLAWQAAEPDPEGRTCSEVAARILDLPAKNVSPNTLAYAEQLEVVKDAIVPVDGTWTPEGVNTAVRSLASLVADVELGLARDIMGLAGDLAQEIKKETISKAAAGDCLTRHVDGKLREAIGSLLGIRALEKSILHEETQRVGGVGSDGRGGLEPDVRGI
jgi:hypothetical protein